MLANTASNAIVFSYPGQVNARICADRTGSSTSAVSATPQSNSFIRYGADLFTNDAFDAGGPGDTAVLVDAGFTYNRLAFLSK